MILAMYTNHRRAKAQDRLRRAKAEFSRLAAAVLYDSSVAPEKVQRAIDEVNESRAELNSIAGFHEGVG